MNPATEPPPLPPQNHRSTSCTRHPDDQFTGFCPSCLCERLAVLDHSTAAAASSSSRKSSSTAAAALRAIFKPSAGGGGGGSSAPSFFPELRRTKSFSASKNSGEGYFSGAFEPQRRSCDVRGRSTLWNLFSQDDDRRPGVGVAAAAAGGDVAESARPSISIPVIEDEEFEEARVSNVSNFGEERVQGSEIVEEREREEIETSAIPNEADELFELKAMKDHLDLDSQTKKERRDLKEIAGSFWSAASVFSKKLQKWRQKQKMKKRLHQSHGGASSATLPVEKPIGRQFRETQSEIADYGFGRRSCDTDPRFSLDAGRISFDDARYSFDEPRASWDGYLVGRSFPRNMPTMLSVVEDAPVVHVSRTDAHIPVEEEEEEEVEADTKAEPAGDETAVPGGSAQTRDYYTDSTSRRPRRSLDRSNSIRKTAAAVVAEIDEMKSSSSAAKVTPAESYSNPNSLREEYSDLNGGSNQGKKSRRWTWNIFGLIHRRTGSGGGNATTVPNGVSRSLSETFGERNGEARSLSGFRSNSSVSWRSSSVRRNYVETNGHGGGVGNGGKKKKDEPPPPSAVAAPAPVVLERTRSARYSPSSVENGMLRFYLAPMRNGVGGGGGRWRAAAGAAAATAGGGNGKGRYNQAHSIARSVLNFY